MEPVELEPRPDDGSGGCRAAIALTVAAACLPLMLGVFAPALRVGALAGAAVLLLGAACLVAVLRSSPTERVRERNRERVALRFGVRSDAWDGFSDGMFATDRDGVTLAGVDVLERAQQRGIRRSVIARVGVRFEAAPCPRNAGAVSLLRHPAPRRA